MRRRKDERGASALEFALVAPVLFLLLFGIVDFGFTYNNIQAVQYAGHEGARAAAVGRTGSSTSCSPQGTASSAGASTQQLICLVKDRAGLDVADTRVKIVLTADGYALGSHVAVCVQYPLQSWSGALAELFVGKVTEGKGVARIERLGSTPIEATEEPAVSGSDWSWCTV